MREELNRIFVRHTNQPLERIEKDSDRDFFMSPAEAKEYGIIDEVIYSRDVARNVVEVVAESSSVIR